MIVPVAKYHGCGNDFILLDEKTADAIDDLVDFTVQVCDRHTGIGADGLIVAREHPLFMEYYNQDGSRAPMCGNGIRCLSRFLFEHGLIDSDSFDVDTLAGVKTVTITSQDPFKVRVNMGQPIDDPKAVDAACDQPIADYALTIGDQRAVIDSLFMATVHTVLFDENAMGDITQTGQAICHHPLFTKQTNVNFVHVLDDHTMEVQTYERGCGVTLACGTGVCASAVVARRKEMIGDSVDVHLKKGVLQIEIDPDETVWMSGPAEKILEGNYLYEPSKRTV